MIIKKSYTRLINIGNFENIKVGIELEKEISPTDIEQIKKTSSILGKLASDTIEQEVEKIKKEYEEKQIKLEEVKEDVKSD